MAWTHNSVNDPVRRAAEMVDEAVTDYRNRGYTREHAVEQAALALDLPKRRIKALLYGEAFSIAADEYHRIRNRFLAHLDEQADHLARRSAEARARRKQMELGI